MNNKTFRTGANCSVRISAGPRRKVRGHFIGCLLFRFFRGFFLAGGKNGGQQPAQREIFQLSGGALRFRLATRLVETFDITESLPLQVPANPNSALRAQNSIFIEFNDTSCFDGPPTRPTIIKKILFHTSSAISSAESGYSSAVILLFYYNAKRHGCNDDKFFLSEKIEKNTRPGRPGGQDLSPGEIRFGHDQPVGELIGIERYADAFEVAVVFQD